MVFLIQGKIIEVVVEFLACFSLEACNFAKLKSLTGDFQGLYLVHKWLMMAL